MKIFLITLAASNLLISSAFADGTCSNQNETWNGARCVTTGAAVAASTGAGIYAAQKYSAANSIEKEYTQKVFQAGQMHSGTDIDSVNRSASVFTNGDRITIIYNLSEAQNRQYHIQLMEDRASSARSTAALYASQALTATHTVSVSDGNGGTRMSVEPDYAARASYAAMATSSYSEASNYERKALDARHGGLVPTYDLKKVVDGKSETARLSKEFTQERIDQGGKVLTIERLPVEKFTAMKSLILRARGGVVGVALGAGLVAEEAIEGAAARAVEKSGYVPKMGSYSDTAR